MPTPLIKSIADKAGVSVEEAEKKWHEAKAIAAESGKSANYAYITSIFKRMLKLEGHLTSYEFLQTLEEQR